MQYKKSAIAYKYTKYMCESYERTRFLECVYHH